MIKLPLSVPIGTKRLKADYDINAEPKADAKNSDMKTTKRTNAENFEVDEKQCATKSEVIYLTDVKTENVDDNSNDEMDTSNENIHDLSSPALNPVVDSVETSSTTEVTVDPLRAKSKKHRKQFSYAELCKGLYHVQNIVDSKNYVYKIVGDKEQINVFEIRCLSSCCKAAGQFIKSTRIIYLAKEHNHAGSSQEANEKLFLHSLFKRIEQEEEKPVQVLYKEEAVKYEGILLPTFQTLRSKLYRIRRADKPALPRTIQEHHIAGLQEKYYVSNSVFYRGLVEADGESALIFMSESARENMHTSEMLLSDSISTIVRSPFLQLYSVHYEYKGEVLPGAYVLMTANTCDLYEKVFRKLVELADINPLAIMSDFETSLLQAIRKVFPACTKQSCWFHFCQSIWRKCQDCGLVQIFKDCQEAVNVVSMLMALPLLASSSIEDGLNNIRQFNKHGSHEAKLIPVIDYVKDFWIGTVGSCTLSYYGLDRKNSNNIEEFHSKINKEFGRKKGFYVFLDQLLCMEKESGLKLAQLNSGALFKPLLKRNRAKQDKIINNLQEKLRTNCVTVEQFLRAAMHASPNFNWSPQSENEALLSAPSQFFNPTSHLASSDLLHSVNISSQNSDLSSSQSDSCDSRPHSPVQFPSTSTKSMLSSPPRSSGPHTAVTSFQPDQLPIAISPAVETYVSVILANSPPPPTNQLDQSSNSLQHRNSTSQRHDPTVNSNSSIRRQRQQKRKLENILKRGTHQEQMFRPRPAESFDDYVWNSKECHLNCVTHYYRKWLYDTTSCTICGETLNDQSLLVLMSCRHVYHANCYLFYQKYRTCPLC